MFNFVVALALLAADGGQPVPSPNPAAQAPVRATPQTPRVVRQTVEIENLGSAPVTLLLQAPDRAYVWGPYQLAEHERIHVQYCPCAGLTLELRSTRRAKPLRYVLRDQSALLLSEDRWSEGAPIVRRNDLQIACGPAARCDGPAFLVQR